MATTPDKRKALLPCPFCGGDASFHTNGDYGHENFGGRWIECRKCDASTSMRFACDGDPVPLLIEAWNRRAPADPVKARPVAWRWVPSKGWRDHVISVSEGLANEVKASGITVEPLYTYSPSPVPQGLSEDQRDAARWRWFRDQCVRPFSFDMGGRHSYCVSGEFGRVRGPSIEAAIDAALAATQGPKT